MASLPTFMAGLPVLSGKYAGEPASESNIGSAVEAVMELQLKAPMAVVSMILLLPFRVPSDTQLKQSSDALLFARMEL